MTKKTSLMVTRKKMVMVIYLMLEDVADHRLSTPSHSSPKNLVMEIHLIVLRGAIRLVSMICGTIFSISAFVFVETINAKRIFFFGMPTCTSSRLGPSSQGLVLILLIIICGFYKKYSVSDIYSIYVEFDFFLHLWKLKVLRRNLKTRYFRFYLIPFQS